jgi:hypothetical protein
LETKLTKSDTPFFKRNQNNREVFTCRVEPSVTPATYVQQPAVPASPSVYNNSQHYNPTQYDPYYNIYDEDVEIYRDVGGKLQSVIM